MAFPGLSWPVTLTLTLWKGPCCLDPSPPPAQQRLPWPQRPRGCRAALRLQPLPHGPAHSADTGVTHIGTTLAAPRALTVAVAPHPAQARRPDPTLPPQVSSAALKRPARAEDTTSDTRSSLFKRKRLLEALALPSVRPVAPRTRAT